MRNEVMNGHQAKNVVKSAMPPRSRLYNLKPEGIDTPYTESLTSYLTRLAEAHCVLTGTLMNKELAPLLDPRGRSFLRRGSLSHLYLGAGAINGSEDGATRWVGALETLTLRSDLRYLTLLTWQNVLAKTGLVRPTRAWCPACFEEQSIGGKVIYEPLLWALDVVTACPQHRCKLQQRCPHKGCHRLLPWLSSQARPGRCGYCQKWLGISVNSDLFEGEQLETSELTWQLWVWENLGELIAFAPQVRTPPLRQRIEKGMLYYVEQSAGGYMTTLARILGINMTIVWQWCRDHSVPTLSNLLRLCYALDISLRSFLLEEDEMPTANLRDLPFQQPEVQPLKRRKPLEKNIMRSVLEAALATEQIPPPSLESVARQVGYRSPRPFYNDFPDLCYAISARHLNYRKMERVSNIAQRCEHLQQSAISLHAQGIYPSRPRLLELGVKEGDFLSPEMHSAWREVLHKLGYE